VPSLRPRRAGGRLAHNPDFNGAEQEGVGFYQTTTHDGKRWSAGAGLSCARRKTASNLVIRTQTRVARYL
jgi:choline dehydrogenase